MSLRLVSILTMLAAPAFAGTIVYDNTATNTGIFLQLEKDGARADGNQVTLAGNLRTITEFGIVLDGFSNATDSQIQIRFFINDGPNGSPSTEIFNSGLVDIALQPTPQLFTIPVPDVRVPQSFTWVMNTGPAGLPRVLAPYHSPAVVGMHEPFTWRLFPNGIWNQTQPSGAVPDRGFGARIVAVPEPTSGLIMIALVTTTSCYRRRN